MKRAEFFTSKGVMKAELYENDTPGTVDNFCKLAQSGFYDGYLLLFCRAALYATAEYTAKLCGAPAEAAKNPVPRLSYVCALAAVSGCQKSLLGVFPKQLPGDVDTALDYRSYRRW